MYPNKHDTQHFTRLKFAKYCTTDITVNRLAKYHFIRLYFIKIKRTLCCGATIDIYQLLFIRNSLNLSLQQNSNSNQKIIPNNTFDTVYVIILYRYVVRFTAMICILVKPSNRHSQFERLNSNWSVESMSMKCNQSIWEFLNFTRNCKTRENENDSSIQIGIGLKIYQKEKRKVKEEIETARKTL